MSLSKDEKTWGMVSHLSALACFVFPFYGNIFGPLVVWLIKKDEMPFVNEQAKESMNFQITASIILTILTVVAFVLSFILVGFLLYPIIVLIGVADLVLIIVAAIKANEGENYRYPFAIRLIK